jgi:hypothetical protein
MIENNRACGLAYSSSLVRDLLLELAVGIVQSMTFWFLIRRPALSAFVAGMSSSVPEGAPSARI